MDPIITTVLFISACVRFDVVRSMHHEVTSTPGRYKTATERRSGLIATTLGSVQVAHHAVAYDTSGSSSVSLTGVSVMDAGMTIEIPTIETGNEIVTTNGSTRDAAEAAIEKLITAIRTTVEGHLNHRRPSEDDVYDSPTSDKPVIGDGTGSTISDQKRLDADDKEGVGADHAANAGRPNEIVPRARDEVVLRTNLVEWILVIIVAFFLIIAFSITYLIGYIRDRRRRRLARSDSEVTLWDAAEDQ